MSAQAQTSHGGPLKIPSQARVALVYRPDTPAALNLAKALAVWLKERSTQVYTAPQQRTLPGTRRLQKPSDLKKCHLVIALGGDGTYLRAIRLLEGHSVPILGINLGSLGFLTPFRADEAFTAVDLSLKGQMELRPSSILDVKLSRGGKTKLHIKALNDVVVERGSYSQLINLSLEAGKEFVSEVKADGLIVSSPTGSTAYNLSAGGPILHPTAKAIVVTPIAPHALTSRPLIFPDELELKIKLLSKPNYKAKAHLVVDGFKLEDIRDGDDICVHRAKETHLMVRDPNQNFFMLLREKLNFGDR